MGLFLTNGLGKKHRKQNSALALCSRITPAVGIKKAGSLMINTNNFLQKVPLPGKGLLGLWTIKLTTSNQIQTQTAALNTIILLTSYISTASLTSVC